MTIPICPDIIIPTTTFNQWGINMLRSFIRRWLGIDSDLSELEYRVSEINRQINTPCPSPNLKPKRKPKAKVKK